MTDHATTSAGLFHQLHAPGSLLVLPNAWDAGSARLFESIGARAIATASSGLNWSQGYPDGGAIPPGVLAKAVSAIARTISVPLTIDIENGYSDDPRAVGVTVGTIIDAGAVGINLEDGALASALLAAKIEAAREAAVRIGVDLFINARTDVYLRGLVPHDAAVAETLARASVYRDAGASGIFVPGVANLEEISALASAIELPLNVMIVPGLATVAELRRRGVRRVSAGPALALTAYDAARLAAEQLIAEGRYDMMLAPNADWAHMNGLFAHNADA
jgi:2-methylisocitrate lyase-like PEP mutase family enzyme